MVCRTAVITSHPDARTTDRSEGGSFLILCSISSGSIRGISLDTMGRSGTRSADTHERDPVLDALGEEGVTVTGFRPAACGRWPFSSNEMTPNKPVPTMSPRWMSASGIPGGRQGTDRAERCPRRLGVRGLRVRGRHRPFGAASTMIRSSRDVTRVAGATVSAGRTLPGTGEP